MRIMLVRHAEPLRGTGERSLADYGLSEIGKRQAESMTSTLTFPIDQIVISSLPRAIETGQVIAKFLNQESPQIIDELCEIGEHNNFETEPGFIMGSIRAPIDIPTPRTGSHLEPKSASLTASNNSDDIWELCYLNLHGAT